MDDITENWWFQLVNMPILIFVFLILNEIIFRPSTEILLWICMLSFVSVPLYAAFIEMDWIQFATLILLCISALLCTFYRYSHHKTEYIQSKWFANNRLHKWSILNFKFTPYATYFIYIMCVLDLLLTTIKELLNSFHWNAIAALFLCFTFPVPSKKIDPPLWYVSNMNKSLNQTNDLIVKCNIGWIASYTSFVGCYVYANYLNGFLRGVALLLIPFIYIIFNYQNGINLWFQTRLYTLWFYYILKVFSFNFFNKYMYCTDDWRLLSDNNHHALLQFWGLINAILSFLQFLYWTFHLTKMTKAVKDVNNRQKQMVNDDENKQQQHEMDDESQPLSPSKC